MGIQMQYDKVEDLPEMSVKELFTEKDGKMVFTGIEGLKTQKDVDNVEESLRKERNDHSEAKSKLRAESDKVKDAERKIEELGLRGGDNSELEQKYKDLYQKQFDGDKAEWEKEREEMTAKINLAQSFKDEISLTEMVNNSTKDKFAKDHQVSVNNLLQTSLQKQVDGEIWLTTENKSFGLPAGLTADKAVEFLAEKHTYMLPQNSAGNATGATGGNGVSSNMEKYTSLKEKVDAGTASRQETNQYIQAAEVVANETKQGEN